MRIFWLLIGLLMCCTNTLAADYYFIEDKNSTYSIDQVRTIEDPQWKPLDNSYFGFSASSFWIRLQVPDHYADRSDLVLSIRDPFVDQAIVYYPDGSSLDFGELVPMSQRDIKYLYPAKNLPRLASSQHIYLKLSSTEPIAPVISIQTSADFTADVIIESIFYGAFFGILIAFLFYNLFLFIITRSLDYLNYIIFLTLFSFVSMLMSGLGQLILLPEHPYINHRLIGISLALAIASATWFTIGFLKIDKQHRAPNLALKCSLALSLAWLFFVVFSPADRLIAITSQAAFLIGPLVIMFAAIYTYRAGHPQAKYFLIAWSIFLVSIVARVLMLTGIIPNNQFNFYAIQSSFVFQAICLSMALAAQIKQLQKEKRELVIQTNQKLKKLNHALERSNQLKDQFLTNVSHELRTPINGAKGMLQILRQHADGKQHKQYDLAIRSTNKIQNIIEKLLILSESQTQKLAFTNHWFDLQGAIDSVAAQITPDAMDNNCTLKINNHASSTIQYFSSYEAIELICLELLENAIKHSDGGEVTLSIDATDAESNHRITICVEDNGLGMDEQTISNIFQPFWQHDQSNTRTVGGLGVGLTVVNEITCAIGGKLHVESESGRGTKISVSLTLKHREKAAPAIARDLAGISVLIVEDNRVNQLLMRAMVKKLNCHTLLASNGEEALQMVKKEAIDIILMDCQMPIMDGFEATHLIRHSEEPYSKLPIIAVTANTTARDRQHCFEVGMDAFLKKPVEIDRLRNAITAYTVAKSHDSVSGKQ